MPKMCKMQVITNPQHIDREAWQRLVDNSSTASWFQTSAAYDFYASLPELMTPFVVAVQEGSELKGVAVGYVTREKNPLKQFFTRRAIIIGGPMLAIDVTDGQLNALLQQLGVSLSKQAIFVEFRNYFDYSKYKSVFENCGFSYHPHYDIVINCDEEMTDRISESKQRKIRKSLQEGMTVSPAQTVEEVETWYRLLKKLYLTKVRKPLWHVSFFLEGWKRKDFVLLLVRDAAAKIVGGVFCPILSNKVIYEWYICGPTLTTYAAMEYAQSHNIPLFNLMGAGTPGKPYGVRDFKAQMGGQLNEYGRFLNINNNFLYWLGKTALDLLYFRIFFRTK